MLIVGERINASLSGVAEAIAGRDGAFVQGLARRQAEAGAHFLEVNAAGSASISVLGSYGMGRL